MPVTRKSDQPTGITNESGEPEIVLDIGGLTLSMTPPGGDPAAPADKAPANAPPAAPRGDDPPA